MRQLTVDQMPATDGEQTPGAQLYTIGGVLGIWLFFTGFQWLLWKINQAISPETLAHYSSLWFAVAGVITLALVYYQRPKIYTLSRLRPEWIDLPIVALCVYVDINLSFLVVEPPFERGFSSPLDMTLTIAILPVIEELICRGVILRSLMTRLDVVWAIVLSSVVFSLFHIAFWPAFIGEIFISLIYVIRRKSLAASILYHVAGNTLVWFPRLFVAAHWRHFV